MREVTVQPVGVELQLVVDFTTAKASVFQCI